MKYMETFKITNTEIISFLLIFFRTGAILFTAPLFGSRSITARVRLLLAFTIAIVLTSVFIGGKGNIPAPLLRFNHTGQLFIAIFREILLGIAIGFTARLTFTSIQLAGEFVGYEMGFGMMRIFDPLTQANMTVTAQYNVVAATLIFILARGHHYILMGIARSFEAIPLAGWVPSASFIGHLNNVFASIFATAFRLAIPVIGAIFLTKVAMGIIARTVPQMNVFIVGFPVQISVGLLAMAISLPFFVKILHTLFITMRENIWAVINNG